MEIAYYSGTMGAGGHYTTGMYVTPSTEVYFYRGLGTMLIILFFALLFYMFWVNRK